MVKYRVISGPYFPAFGLNTERYEVSLRIQTECEKYGPETTPYLDTFHTVLLKTILAENNPPSIETTLRKFGKCLTAFLAKISEEAN